jgi:2-oxoglutarate ferredoxin oxidoreductase subunit delta
MQIVIDKNLCKGCYICVSVCPKKVFEISAELSTDYNVSIPKRVEDCIVCRLCEISCPEMAIDVLDEESCDEMWAEKGEKVNM